MGGIYAAIIRGGTVRLPGLDGGTPIVDYDCVGRLMADVIGQLAAENAGGEIDKPALRSRPA